MSVTIWGRDAGSFPQDPGERAHSSLLPELSAKLVHLSRKRLLYPHPSLAKGFCELDSSHRTLRKSPAS